ncbi:phosphoglycolate phosphatase [Corynebacterium pseudotuberculosis]|uniref:HAD-IA family hydrolase n=1 Tax=Corynebacterium pseudotuberculosis TaxID=1719 RepID=UPI000259259E|nr:HAD-IA family hydrolase [Corynebacterium pseudotuberculosis]AFH91294.1 HAD-IA family hydrolase [Corynebacterium pseudotuberculosis 31]APB11326.1 phosphoglycolate phosphatase [Corynebacterium pseudotuberculosis]APB13370.1 phosphoglycolate phosphatase [Corynebacterium pseudotuberculosis]APB15414.1 phosphoglycolate phosphatase [Corynebacterium pseudotuberculosis]APB17459.1 phosphoglycolate phosphatase [Corynebacterium pseudotuberculosis]
MSTLLIDLDGTIVRSYPGIRTSFIEAMHHIGHPVPDEDWLHRIPGPPMEETMRSLGLPPDTTSAALKAFRRHYDGGGWRDCELFAGWAEALPEWKSQGLRICTATSKSESLAHKILSELGVAQYFDVIAGADAAQGRKTKAQVIAHALRFMNIENTHSDILMIGDRFHDVEGAREYGIPTALVGWGHGNPSEWETAHFYASDMADLKGIVRDFF